jgi:hypothetical protein
MFTEIGRNLIQGLIKGVTGMLSALKSTIVGAASSVANWFKEKLGIHSPSRVFAGLGGFVMAGLDQGLADNTAGPLDRISDLSEGMTQRLQIAATDLSFNTLPAPPLADEISDLSARMTRQVNINPASPLSTHDMESAENARPPVLPPPNFSELLPNALLKPLAPLADLTGQSPREGDIRASQAPIISAEESAPPPVLPPPNFKVLLPTTLLKPLARLADLTGQSPREGDVRASQVPIISASAERDDSEGWSALLSRMTAMSAQITSAIAAGSVAPAMAAASPPATQPMSRSDSIASAPVSVTYKITIHADTAPAKDIAQQVREAIEQLERERRGRSFLDD